MTDSITVNVPATSANLGPGFDCLGIALSLWNTLSMKISESPEVIIHGEGDPLIRVKNAILIRTDKLSKKQVLSKMSKYIDRLN